MLEIVVFVVVIIIVLILLCLNQRNQYPTEQHTEIKQMSPSNTTYTDSHGYLRYVDTDCLVHRDVAFQNHLARSDIKFSKCDVHHKDGNKLNNDPNNLEVLKPDEHLEKHNLLLVVDGKRYRRIGEVRQIRRQTPKAYFIFSVWYPKSRCIIQDGILYCEEWLFEKKKYKKKKN